MTFRDALHGVAADIFLKVVVPERALGLTKRTRNIKVAFDELHVSSSAPQLVIVDLMEHSNT